jgi:hypothetical protein
VSKLYFFLYLPPEIYVLIISLSITYILYRKDFFNRAKLRQRDQIVFEFEKLGFTQNNKRKDELVHLCAANDIFKTARKRTGDYSVTNVYTMQSPKAVFTFFDVSYIAQLEGSNDDYELTTDAQTTLLMEPEIKYVMRMPDFDMVPETLYDKAVDILVNMDIDFPDSPVFSSLYFLFGEEYNKDRIRRFFRREIRSVFERYPGMSCLARNGKLFLFQAQKVHDINETSQLLDLAKMLERSMSER